MPPRRERFLPFPLGVFLSATLCTSIAAQAPTTSAADRWSLHAQATFVDQYVAPFTSPYQGPNSLAPDGQSKETFDATLYLGARLWPGGALYANPEVDQGFGLSNTVGIAGFPSGEAYKVGSSTPYLRLDRLFLRQSFSLGGDRTSVADAANQLREELASRRLTITVGKFAVTDIVDNNSLAHDPRGDFLNWSIIDAGAFDYAADAWGYTYGVTGELTWDRWSFRTGLLDLSKVPNSPDLEHDFSQNEFVAEGETRYTLFGHDGVARLLGFVNHGRMGSYQDAIALANATGGAPNTALVRREASTGGWAFNLEQGLSTGLSLFGRLSERSGTEEAFEFTEIDQSAALGMTLHGAGWGRPKDAVGVAGVINWISDDARRYLADGGIGILIGDGALGHYGNELIAEGYYCAQLAPWLTTSIDGQWVDHPAYNRDRGPAPLLALRVHLTR